MSDVYDKLPLVAQGDVEELIERDKSYGSSWKRRGGVGAYMMLVRKSDRLDVQLKRGVHRYDVITRIVNEMALGEADGIHDDLKDLRRYAMLIEAECLRILDTLPRCKNHQTRVDCPLRARYVPPDGPAEDGLCARCADEVVLQKGND